MVYHRRWCDWKSEYRIPSNDDGWATTGERMEEVDIANPDDRSHAIWLIGIGHAGLTKEQATAKPFEEWGLEPGIRSTEATVVGRK